MAETMIKKRMFEFFDAIKELVTKYVTEHQGEKGYIDTHVRMDDTRDKMWTYEFASDGSMDIMFIHEIIAVKVEDGELYVLANECDCEIEDDFNPLSEEWEDDWFHIRSGNFLTYETLGSIAESIEQYV